ncbi:unnamed protein product [Ilex paraguariensis]|uniref:DCD domain-containing protein n=1 Tax=Ilex paraguariensis TaxID=185542 RepID=A0ABC8RI28_9AQUA
MCECYGGIEVRFTVLNDCLPLAEEKFRKVIKENYYTRNKFNCQLTSEQVKKLCKLFVTASEGPKLEKLTRSLRAETHRSLDHERNRRRGKERRSTLGGERERRYYERPVRYEREVFASPVAPVSRVRPLPQPALLPSYAYERTLEMDPYRRDPLSEHREAYRRDPLLEHRDGYRQDPLSEHRDGYRRDPLSERRDAYRRDPLSERRDAYRRDPLSEPHDAYRREPLFEDRVVYRRDPLLKHHDRRHSELESRHLDDNARRDAYSSYRERPAVYSVGLPREHNPPADLPPEYHRERLLPEYRSSAGPLPEYHRFQPLYRY